MEPKAYIIFKRASHGESFRAPDANVWRKVASSTMGVFGWIWAKYASTRDWRSWDGSVGLLLCPDNSGLVIVFWLEKIDLGAILKRTRSPARADEGPTYEDTRSGRRDREFTSSAIASVPSRSSTDSSYSKVSGDLLPCVYTLCGETPLGWWSPSWATTGVCAEATGDELRRVINASLLKGTKSSSTDEGNSFWRMLVVSWSRDRRESNDLLDQQSVTEPNDYSWQHHVDRTVI